MPGVDLSTLSASDLRRLLDRAQARGQTALAEQINAALVAKGRSAPTRALGSPAPITHDDWAHDDWAYDEDDDPSPLEAYAAPAHDTSRAAFRRRSGRPLLALGGGFAAGVLAWTLSGLQPTVLAPSPPRPAQPPRAMLARYEPTPSATLTAPPAAAPAPVADAASASAEPAPAKKVDRCAGLATRGERLVCGDPRLTAQQRRLQEAYIRALNLRADPQVVDGGQAAFRLALSRADDPERLTQLFDSRIRELNSATAAAQAGRGPD